MKVYVLVSDWLARGCDYSGYASMNFSGKGILEEIYPSISQDLIKKYMELSGSFNEINKWPFENNSVSIDVGSDFMGSYEATAHVYEIDIEKGIDNKKDITEKIKSMTNEKQIITLTKIDQEVDNTKSRIN